MVVRRTLSGVTALSFHYVICLRLFDLCHKCFWPTRTSHLLWDTSIWLDLLGFTYRFHHINSTLSHNNEEPPISQDSLPLWVRRPRIWEHHHVSLDGGMASLQQLSPIRKHELLQSGIPVMIWILYILFWFTSGHHRTLEALFIKQWDILEFLDLVNFLYMWSGCPWCWRNQCLLWYCGELAWCGLSL